MNLSTETIHDVIHPTAIFCHRTKDDERQAKCSTGNSSTQWEHSQLNPKNRIDSLAPLKSPLWRIDGCAGLGTQFYAVPLFLKDVPPMRCDVLLCEDTTKSPLMRRLLDLETVFHARDRDRVQRQGVCHYILRALQWWTIRQGAGRIGAIYDDYPFGTRIIFNTLPTDVRNVDVNVVPGYNLESHHCSAQELADMWQINVEGEMPPTMDIKDLVFVQQLHDSVCTVRLRDFALPNGLNGNSREIWVLKALTSSVKYMYHELRVLLKLSPHPNVVAKPVRLVTKKCKMNNMRVVVVGFLLPFYSGGGLRDQLPLLRLSGLIELRQQISWAKDICAGMLHIRQEAKTYYPDLRLDQIVLAQDGLRPIILDFEQRGVWIEFGPPEVNALECLRVLALDEEENETFNSHGSGVKGHSPSRQHFSNILTQLHPGWREVCIQDAYYDNPEAGYNIPWMCLTPREQEFAEVYMFGRLMWCIFEGMAAPQRGAVWQSYSNEPEFDFPEFRRTPEVMRSLIMQCTRGHRDQLSNYIVRKGSRIVFRDDLKRGEGTAAEIKAAAKGFWETEIAWAESFILERAQRRKKGTWNENHFGRRTLVEVQAALSEFQYMTASD